MVSPIRVQRCSTIPFWGTYSWGYGYMTVPNLGGPISTPNLQPSGPNPKFFVPQKPNPRKVLQSRTGRGVPDMGEIKHLDGGNFVPICRGFAGLRETTDVRTPAQMGRFRCRFGRTRSGRPRSVAERARGLDIGRRFPPEDRSGSVTPEWSEAEASRSHGYVQQRA